MAEDSWWPRMLHVCLNPGRIFMLTALLLPPSPGGGSHNLSLRLMSPLTAQVKRKGGGEGNEERMGEPTAPRVRWWMVMIACCFIIGIQFTALTFTRVHKLYVLGRVPRALLCRAKLLCFREDLLNMPLMCCLFMRGGGAGM